MTGSRRFAIGLGVLLAGQLDTRKNPWRGRQGMIH